MREAVFKRFAVNVESDLKVQRGNCSHLTGYSARKQGELDT